MLIIFDNEVVSCEVVEVGDVRIQAHLWCVKGWARNQFFNNIHVAIVNVSVGNHVNKLASFHAANLCNHHQQDCVLANIPVVSGKNVLATLNKQQVKRWFVLTWLLSNVIDCVECARVEVHLGEVGKGVQIGHNTTAERILFEILEYAIHLVIIAVSIVRNLSNLITVSFANGARLISPRIPDVRVEVVNVVGLLLVNPQNLVHGALESGTAKRQRRKLLTQIVAIADAKLLDCVCGSTVFPGRANFLALGGGAVFNNVGAHINKNAICFAHIQSFKLRFKLQ